MVGSYSKIVFSKKLSREQTHVSSCFVTREPHSFMKYEERKYSDTKYLCMN